MLQEDLNLYYLTITRKNGPICFTLRKMIEIDLYN